VYNVVRAPRAQASIERNSYLCVMRARLNNWDVFALGVSARVSSCGLRVGYIVSTTPAGMRSCRRTYRAYKAHRSARNSCAVSPWSLIGLSSLSPSGPAVTLDVLVLERRSESRENILSKVDLSFVNVDLWT